MKKTFMILLLLGLMCSEQSVIAQRVLQDSQGKTSFNYLGGSSQIIVNMNASSIEVGTARGDNTGLFYGVRAKTAAKSGVKNLMQNGDFSLDGTVGGFLSYSFSTDNIDNDATLFNLYGGVDVNVSKFKLYDASKITVSDKVFGDSYLSPNLILGGFFQGSILNIIGGVALDIGAKDNTNDLSSLEITSVQYINSNTIVLGNRKSAYDASLYKSNIFYRNIYFDVGKIIADRFILVGHGRVYTDSSQKPSYSPGIGLYFNKANNKPLEVIGGIQYQFMDVFDTREPTKSVSDKSIINLVAGFVFE